MKKMQGLGDFIANNAKTANPNSLFCTKSQFPNNQLITSLTLPKASRSYLIAISKAERRVSEG